MNARPLSFPQLHDLGDRALTVTFGRSVERRTFDRVGALAGQLEGGEGIRELVPTFCALSIHYDPLQVSAQALRARVAEALQGPVRAAAREGRTVTVPVCFEEDLAPDLLTVAEATGWSAQAIVSALCRAPLRVYMLGFLPGFPYMGGLPKALALPRRSEPRLAVPARSLAIAGELCAIYPCQSPGGWHLLGRTSLRLFDPCRQPPALFRAGDRVSIAAVDRRTYQNLCQQEGWRQERSND